MTSLVSKSLRRVAAALAPASLLLLFVALSHSPMRASVQPGDTSQDLIQAVRAGDTAAVSKLLKAGADPDAFDDEMGVSALQLAAFLGHEHIVAKLLKANANPNFVDADKSSVLHWALECVDVVLRDDIVGLLVEAGADPNLSDINGHSPLYLAVLEADTAVIKLLIMVGANVNEPDAKGIMPITALLNGKPGPVHTRCAQLLLEAGASPDASDPETGDSPLHQAVRADDAELVHYLMDHNADANMLNNENLTPLQLAIKLNFNDLFDILSARSLTPQKP